MTVIRSLLYSIINVNVLIDFWSFFIDFRESSVLINDVVHSIIFLLKLTVAIVVIFIVIELVVLICSLIIVYSKLLRIVRSVFSFTLLIVELVRSILILFIILIWVWIYVFCCSLQWLILIVSESLQWNHSWISKLLLIEIRWGILICRIKRKSVLHWTVWRRKKRLTIRRLILRLIWSLILTLTRKIKIKTFILTVLVFFKLRTLIFTVSITVMLITHALIVTVIMSVHVSSSVFLKLKSLNKLTDCDSISK